MVDLVVCVVYFVACKGGNCDSEGLKRRQGVFEVQSESCGGGLAKLKHASVLYTKDMKEETINIFVAEAAEKSHKRCAYLYLILLVTFSSVPKKVHEETSSGSCC